MHLIDRKLIDAVLNEARQSPRRRKNYNFHSSDQDNPHRFLNVMLERTYIAPHRHLQPPKAEAFLVLEGRVALLTFDDDGGLTGCHYLGEGGSVGIDLEPGVWHTLVVLSPHAVCYEVKPGPYDPSADKEFAPWAPREGEPGIEAMLRRLRDLALSHR